MLVTVSLTMLVRRTGEATHGVVLAMVAADILFVFAIAGVATPPEYYVRSLLFVLAASSFIVCYGSFRERLHRSAQQGARAG